MFVLGRATSAQTSRVSIDSSNYEASHNSSNLRLAQIAKYLPHLFLGVSIRYSHSRVRKDCSNLEDNQRLLKPIGVKVLAPRVRKGYCPTRASNKCAS